MFGFFADPGVTPQDVLDALASPPPPIVARMHDITERVELFLEEQGTWVLSLDWNPFDRERPEDGKLLDASGEYREPSEWRSLEALKPEDESRMDGKPTFFVNGIMNDQEMAFGTMGEYVEASGNASYGIHNASGGAFLDVLESIADKAELGNNPAVTTVRDLVEEFLLSGEELRLVGDSQGALIISRALSDVSDALREQGLSQSEIELALGRIEVETIGGAAWDYPDGPRYTHYVNEADPIAVFYGLATYGLSDAESEAMIDDLDIPLWLEVTGRAVLFTDVHRHLAFQPGKDAKIVRFRHDDSDWISTHWLGTYMDYYLRDSFDDRRVARGER